MTSKLISFSAAADQGDGWLGIKGHRYGNIGITIMVKRLYLHWVSLLLALPVVCLAAPAAALMSQNYPVSGAVIPGMLVSSQAGGTAVQAADVTTASSLRGIAVDVADGQAVVASAGVIETLVSTQGGDIQIGDIIAPSSLAGIGMKARPGSRAVGIAQAAFKTGQAGSVQQPLPAKSGRPQTVSVARVPLLVRISDYPNTAQTAVLPPLLQRTLDQLAGQPVSPPIAVSALGIVGLGVILAIVLILGSAKHGLVSLGRNPLARDSITGNLARILGLAIGLLGVSLVLAYALITLA